MKRFYLLILILPFIITCASSSNSQTLSQAKENLSCMEYIGDIPWEKVKQALGEASIPVLPEPGTDLFQNARGYTNLKVFFHTTRKNLEEAGRIRPHEVVYKVEICKEK